MFDSSNLFNTLFYLLCISTSFWVLRAPEGQLKHFLQLFSTYFIHFRCFFLDFSFKMNKKGWKRWKKYFWPAFACAQQPKAGPNTQHLSFFLPLCVSPSFLQYLTYIMYVSLYVYLSDFFFCLAQDKCTNCWSLGCCK